MFANNGEEMTENTTTTSEEELCVIQAFEVVVNDSAKSSEFSFTTSVNNFEFNEMNDENRNNFPKFKLNNACNHTDPSSQRIYFPSESISSETDSFPKELSIKHFPSSRINSMKLSTIDCEKDHETFKSLSLTQLEDMDKSLKLQKIVTQVSFRDQQMIHKKRLAKLSEESANAPSQLLVRIFIHFLHLIYIILTSFYVFFLFCL
jgi:hypothetical protein